MERPRHCDLLVPLSLNTTDPEIVTFTFVPPAIDRGGRVCRVPAHSYLHTHQPTFNEDSSGGTCFPAVLDFHQIIGFQLALEAEGKL